MLWLVLVVVLVVLAVGVWFFYRHAQDVEGELEAMPGGAPPPMFGTVQGRVRRRTNEESESGSSNPS